MLYNKVEKVKSRNTCFASVVKDLDTRSPWVNQWFLKLLASVLIRKRKGDHVKMVTETGAMLAQADAR